MRGAWTVVRELLRGAGITSRHFFVNMAFHALRLVGLRTGRKGAVTIQYPEERKALSPRHRSLHRLRAREDGRPACVACMLCATICPAKDKTERHGRPHPRLADNTEDTPDSFCPLAHP